MDYASKSFLKRQKVEREKEPSIAGIIGQIIGFVLFLGLCYLMTVGIFCL